VVPQTREVTVNVCRYEDQQRQATRTVTEMVPETREVLVNVCRYENQEKTGTRTVYESVPETRQVTVNVCSYQPVQKEGVRRRVVCETVQETVDVTRTYTERVPYQVTVKVPIYGPAQAQHKPCD
jgi:hypothetical protein